MGQKQVIKQEPMTIVTYTLGEQECIAFLVGENLYNLKDVNAHIPTDKELLMQCWQEWEQTIVFNYCCLYITQFKGVRAYKRDEAKDIKTIYYEGLLV